MKKVFVSDLKGGEYIAKPVYRSNEKLLLYEGTCINEDVIRKLLDNEILAVDIFESESIGIRSKEIIKKEVHADCKSKVKNVLEKHVCQSTQGIVEISEAADEIITDIFSNEEVIDIVYDIKERSADLYDHSISVSALSILTAIKYNLSKEIVKSIGIGSLLHDLGLNYVNIPYTDVDIESFNPDNLFEYKKHTVYGYSSVEKEKWMNSIERKIVLFHHERINGTGYPLKQKNIPIEVKIVSVCDSFDDKICGIGCKQMKVPEAIDHLRSYKDIYYDGKIVDIFLNFIAEYPIGTVLRLNTREEAIVIEQNELYTDRPVLKVIKNTQGPVDEEKIVNLADNRFVTIEEVIN